MPMINSDKGESLTCTNHPTPPAQAPGRAALPEEPIRRIIASGQCGDNLQYEIDDAYTVTIRGTGIMYDYWFPKDIPWKDYPIKKVLVKEGVESLGMSAFGGCKDLAEIELPDSLQAMSDLCLDGTAIRELYIPDHTTTIYGLGYLPALAQVSLPDSMFSFSLHSPYNTMNGTALDVYFRGKPPKTLLNLHALDCGKVTAHYPASEPAWTQEARSQFMGNITWLPITDET